ncbi:hypothetical protein C0J52_05414 [Blattella germanica]|nr:hypothetical protein C0J52_05414 [Blattella germanica]
MDHSQHQVTCRPLDPSATGSTLTEFQTRDDDLSALMPYTIVSTLQSFQPFSHKAVDIFAEYSKKDFSTSAARLGLTTGVALAFILKSQLPQKNKTKIGVWLQEMVLRYCFAAACLILALTAAPFVGIFIIVLMCYHQGVHIFLKLTQKHYVELFEGLDAVWAVEKETSRSIINALTFFEVENMEQGNTLLYTFRKLVADRLATSPLPCPKMFYLRRRCLGYFYWEKQVDLTIEDYIRPMQIVPSEYQSTNYNMCEFPNSIAEETLKNYVAEICNTTLPKNNAASWEILVGSHPITKSPTSLTDDASKGDFGKTVQYPILFRVHHSLGDGLSLMQLLVSVMYDDFQPKLPPPPILARKFPNPTNVPGKYETVESVSQTQKSCKIDNSFVSRHQAQSPPRLNLPSYRNIASKRQIINANVEKCAHSMESFSRNQNRNLFKVNEVAIDLESIEENDVDLKSDCTDLDINIECTSPPRKINNSLLMNCRQRPLLLENNCATFNQQQSSYFTESQWQSQNACNDSNHNPYPTPHHLRNFEKFSACTSKISSSYDQPFNEIPPNYFSQTLSSNFQTSLPLLNLCQFPKNNMKDCKISSRITSQDPEDNFDSADNLTNSDQNIRCQSPTPTRMSLEEPLSLFNNPKQNVTHSVPKNLNKLPMACKTSCNQNTTLHCYNRTMSDSYITIPEDLSCSSIETTDKSTSLSTTIYYYSPATSPVSPVQYSNNSNNAGIEQKIAPLEHEKNTLQKSVSTSLFENKSSNCSENNSIYEASFVESSFDGAGNIETAAHVKSCTSLPTSSFVCSPMQQTFIQDCSSSPRVIQDLRWDNVSDGSQNEIRKTKSDGDLNEELQINSLELRVHTIANVHTENNYFTREVSTICDKVNTPDLNKSANTRNSHDLSRETKSKHINLEEQYSHPSLRELTVNWNKFWRCIGRTQGKSNNVKHLKYETQVSNQYVELLNTISNSTTSLNITDKFSKLIQTLCTIALLPATVIHQILMKADRSILHGSPLSGYKVIAWHKDQDGNLFNRIKRAKHISNTRFTEVFLSALSASLETYFETHQVFYNDRTPDLITVVIPARMEPIQFSTVTSTSPLVMKKEIKQNQGNTVPVVLQEDNETFESSKYPISKNLAKETISIETEGKMNDCTVSLNNRFSIAMLQLPVCQNADKYSKQSPKSRLNAVHHQSQLLRKSLDYQVNYWLLRVMATYLPEAILDAVVQSSQSTMVVSNIMGPTQELSFASNKLKDIIFWVPNRDMTDRALIHCKEDAQMILDELIVEICKLDAAFS